MDRTTHIRSSNKVYYGAIILCILFILYESFANNRALAETATSALGLIAIAAVLYSLYKIFLGKGKIILSESEFKIQGYNWTNWDDLSSLYPFAEQDSENGERHFIKFRLKDGTDLSVRSEYLEMTFEQIAELVNQYRANYSNTKK
jgi:amino acid permease